METECFFKGILIGLMFGVPIGAVGITNPAAILTFLFAFAYFGIAEISGVLNGILLVAGVFIGTYIWWTALSGVVCIIKRKSGNCGLPFMNKIFGVVLILFAAVILGKAVMGGSK